MLFYGCRDHRPRRSARGIRVRLSRADEDIGPYENFGRNCVGAAVLSRPHGMNCGPMGGDACRGEHLPDGNVAALI